MHSHSDKAHRVIAELMAFGLISAASYVIQKFLFPLEGYWIGLLCGLLVYTLTQWLLVDEHCFTNIFIALDEGQLQLVDTLYPFMGPLVIAGGLTTADQGLFVFLLPVVWVICIMQSCISAIAARSLVYLRNSEAHSLGVQTTTWVVRTCAVVFLCGLLFFSGGTGKPVYPLLSGDPAVKGVWFTIPVQKSELFPAGYARLEDSVFDDLGRIFVADLGQTLGLVEACDVPGSVISQSVQMRVPSPLVQPRFTYATDSMCPKWIAALPGFFWKIGLSGILLLALVVGIHGFGDPIDFGILSLVLLFGWISLPIPTTIRMGNVAVLIAGIPLVALIFPLFRCKRYSFLLVWGLFSGVMFGLAAFVRRPCGLALLATSSVVLAFLGIRQRRMVLAMTSLLALLVGNSLIPSMMNGLFLYRDVKLQISAPRISPLVHGSGAPLLGGVGGKPVSTAAGTVPQYDNALDMAFLDAPIWYAVYDRNPMIGFAQRSFTLMQDTGQQVFLHYVTQNPLEFALTALRKAYATARLAVGVVHHWPRLLLLQFGLLALRHVVFRGRVRRNDFSDPRVPEMIFAFILLLVLAALPAVLTTPYYGESAQLPAAVLFIVVVVAIEYASQALGSRADRR